MPAPYAREGEASGGNALADGKNKIASLETDDKNRCTDDFAELVTVPGVGPHDGGGGLSDRRRRVGVAVVGDGVDDDDRRRRLRQRGHCLQARGARAHHTSATGSRRYATKTAAGCSGAALRGTSTRDEAHRTASAAFYDWRRNTDRTVVAAAAATAMTRSCTARRPPEHDARAITHRRRSRRELTKNGSPRALDRCRFGGGGGVEHNVKPTSI